MVASNLIRAAGFIALVGSLGFSSAARAQSSNTVPAELRGVRFDQNLNVQLPLDAAFLDETGKPVHLGDYFNNGQRPVILALVYYECPMLCNLELNGLFKTLKSVSLKPGKDYDVVAVSFDARETPALAAAKKETYLKEFGKPEAAPGLHFLTGKEDQIRRVTDAAGFHYEYDKRQNQFAHASGIIVATPEGRLARYFYGIQYKERDLRLGLVEASAHKIGSPVDEVLLFCFHYDPATGKYGFIIQNVLRVTGGATVLALLAFVAIMLRGERKRRVLARSGGKSSSNRGHWRSA